MTPRSLVWLNRQGQEEPTGAPLRTYGTARVSPDGSRAVVAVYDDSLDDLWIWDFARRTLERVTKTAWGGHEPDVGPQRAIRSSGRWRHPGEPRLSIGRPRMAPARPNN